MWRRSVSLLLLKHCKPADCTGPGRRHAAFQRHATGSPQPGSAGAGAADGVGSPPAGVFGSRGAWLDPRRPVSVKQGTLALLLLGGVAVGSQADRLSHAAAPAESSGEMRHSVDGVFAPFRALAHASPPRPPSLPEPAPTATVPLSGTLGPYFIADAAAKAAPAVVNILVQYAGGNVGSSGSGFIVDKEGTILTNAHVVADAIPQRGGAAANGGAPNGGREGKRTITVTLHDGRAFEASLLNFDSVSDLALLKVDADGVLPCARLGSSAGLRAGEWVVAMGSPLHLQNSVSAGIVSCVERKPFELGLAEARTAYIQTDASIARGSSGGPLVNLAGEVVGVSCMKALAADGVSFAIPIDTCRDVVAQLQLHGRVIRPYIGVKLLQLNPHNAAQLRAREPSFPDVSGGVLVAHIYPGSPAEAAGLRQGDVIVGFGGNAREATTAGLIRALGQHIGRGMEVRVRRRGGDGAGRGPEVVLTVTAQEAGEGPVRAAAP